ncbi:hypothetical protein [Actinacidiphila oryziradicis]|uniref:hypothetical protein n=1 Tax=Actinacidiphila oryziradicis TaxID=2571141 RepID=UPI00145CA213|nr:hypothetical protein [Actinacidiphila oryziradicis]
MDALRTADPTTKARLYRALGLRMTYDHGQRKMRVGIAPDPHPDFTVGERYVSEGGSQPFANAGWPDGEVYLA